MPKTLQNVIFIIAAVCLLATYYAFSHFLVFFHKFLVAPVFGNYGEPKLFASFVLAMSGSICIIRLLQGSEKKRQKFLVPLDIATTNIAFMGLAIGVPLWLSIASIFVLLSITVVLDNSMEYPSLASEIGGFFFGLFFLALWFGLFWFQSRGLLQVLARHGFLGKRLKLFYVELYWMFS